VTVQPVQMTRRLLLATGGLGPAVAAALVVANVVAAAAARAEAGLVDGPCVDDVDAGVHNQSKRLVDIQVTGRLLPPRVPTGGRSPACQQRSVRVLVNAVGGDR
jgi:hypothetical protein